jgi:hypothetical protein
MRTPFLPPLKVFRYLPIGTLVSWIQGFQYTLDVESRNHQISQRRPARGGVTLGRFKPSVIEALTLSGVFQVCKPTKKWVSSFEDEQSGALNRFTFTNSERNEPMSISYLLREQPPKETRFLPDASRSNGNPRIRPKRPFGKAETPKRWNARRCYHVHPYWTTNLKYVY